MSDHLLALAAIASEPPDALVLQVVPAVNEVMRLFETAGLELDVLRVIEGTVRRLAMKGTLGVPLLGLDEPGLEGNSER